MKAPRIERKLAAILAADVVGYSRLVGLDEAGTIARLRTLRQEFIEPLIAEYRGRVVKLMGDGALVEFASAVDAVECAVAIQKGIAERTAGEPEERRLQLRIGINLGDILVEDDDILGDGVNIAARFAKKYFALPHLWFVTQIISGVDGERQFTPTPPVYRDQR